MHHNWHQLNKPSSPSLCTVANYWKTREMPTYPQSSKMVIGTWLKTIDLFTNKCVLQVNGTYHM